MFGKLKKQKSKSPVEEMEQFYLNQFMNNPKNPPQGYNGMSPLGQMMGPNTSAGPQFQGRNGMGTIIGGTNPMMNNNFNPNQLPIMNHSNQNPYVMNQPQMMNNGSNQNPYLMNQPQMMNNGSNQNPYLMNQPQMMNNGLNQNPYSMSQPQMMNNGSNQNPYLMNQPQMMNNGSNQNPYLMNQPQMMNNELNQNPYLINQPQMMNNGLNQNPYSMNQPQTMNTGLNQNPYSMNQPQIPSLINDSLIGAEPSFPGQFSSNNTSLSSTNQQLPDLTPSLEDLTGTNILSNHYFRPTPPPTIPFEPGAGVQATNDNQQTTPTTPIDNSSLTPTNSAGTTNPNIPTTSVNPTVPSSLPQTLIQTNPNQIISPCNQYQNTSNSDIYDFKNKVDNINIRLRKVESYLGFRPETTI